MPENQIPKTLDQLTADFLLKSGATKAPPIPDDSKPLDFNQMVKEVSTGKPGPIANRKRRSLRKLTNQPLVQPGDSDPEQTVTRKRAGRTNTVEYGMTQFDAENPEAHPNVRNLALSYITSEIGGQDAGDVSGKTTSNAGEAAKRFTKLFKGGQLEEIQTTVDNFRAKRAVKQLRPADKQKQFFTEMHRRADAALGGTDPRALVTDPAMETGRTMNLPAPAELHLQTDAEKAQSRRKDDTAHESGMEALDQLAPDLSAEDRQTAKSFIISRLGGYGSGNLETQRDVMGDKLKGTETSASNAAQEFLALHQMGKTEEIAKTISDFQIHREHGHMGRVRREEQAKDPTATQSFLNEFNAGMVRGQEQFEDNLGGNYAEKVFKNKDSHPVAKVLSRLWSGLVTGTAETLQMPADVLLGDLPTLFNSEGDASLNDRMGAALNVAAKGLAIAATAAGVGQGVKMIGAREVLKGAAKIAYEIGPAQFGDPEFLKSNTQKALDLIHSGKVSSEEMSEVADALTKRLSPEEKSLAHLNARQIIQAANDAGADINVKDALAASHINVALGKTATKDGTHPLTKLGWQGKSHAEASMHEHGSPVAAQEPLAQGTKGQYQFDEATKTGLATLFKNADITTILHETAHHYLHYMPESEFQTFAKSLGVNTSGKPLNELSPEDYRTIQEHFARGVEQSIHDGKTSDDPATQGMFDRAAKRFKEIYGEAAGVPTPPKVTSGDHPVTSEDADAIARLMHGNIDPEAPKPRSEFGTSNASMAESPHIDAPVGKGRSAAELVQNAETDHESAITLGKLIASGEQPYNAKNAAQVQAGVGLLEARVNEAAKALDNAQNGSAAQDRAVELFTQAKHELQEFADNVQRGKSDWSDVGRILQTRVDETGNFARMQETLRRDKKGQSLSPSEESEVKEITQSHEKAVADLDAANAEILKLRAEAELTHSAKKRKNTADVESRQKAAVQRIRELISAGESSSSAKVLNQDPSEMDLQSAIKELAVAHVHGGARGIDGVVENILKDIPDLTRDQIIQAISAKKESTKTLSEAQKAVNDMRTEARRLSREARNSHSKGLTPEEIAKRRDVLKKSIADYEARIAAGDFRVETKPEIQKAKEILALEAERDFLSRRFQSMRRSAQNPKSMATKVIQELAGAVRFSALGADLGQVMRQGRFSIQHPKSVIEGLKHLGQAMVKEENFKTIMHEIDSKRYSDGMSAKVVRARGGLSTTDAIGMHEEGFVSKIMSHIPVIGAPLERAQTAYMHTVRTGIFDAFYESAIMHPEELKMRAKLINSLTGRSNIKQVPEALQTIMTSPRFAASRFEAMVHPVRDTIHSLKGNRGAQANMKDFAANVATMAAPLFVADKILKARDKRDGVTLDPNSSDFLKVRIDGHVYDISAGMAPKARQVLQMALAVKGRDPKTLTDTAKKMAFSQVSPGVTVPAEIYMGKNFLGYEPESGEAKGWQKMLPLIVQQTMKDINTKQGPVITTADAFAEFIGFSVSQYPRPKKKLRRK